MRRPLITLAIWFLLIGTSAAQATRIAFGTTLPSACATGNIFYKTGGSPGFYTCEANAWSGPYPTSAGAGTVTATGSPATGNLAKFSGATSITNGDLSGDVATSGTLAATIQANAVTTAKILNANVTLAKIQNAGANSRVLGAGSAGTGTAYSELTLGAGLALTGTVLNTVGGSGGSGNSTYTGAAGSEPAANAGDLYFPNNGFYAERYSGSAWKPWGPLYPMTPPVSGDFAWINQGGATVDTTYGGIYLEAPLNATATSIRIRKKAAPATPYTITMAFIPNLFPGIDQECGLIYRESGSGKLLTFSAAHGGASLYLLSQYFSSPTAFSGGNLAETPYVFTGVVFLRIGDDGANRTQSISADGQHWTVAATQVRTATLTADEVGFYVNDGSNAKKPGCTILSWLEG